MFCGFTDECDRFIADEEGMGVVEVILIIVVLVGIVIVFKKQIGDLVDNIWNSINKNAQTVYK
ncbi:MAG: hypothetical protein IKQ71_00655 [Lachnospiraceae bacterium]|nr:hypothetical protein [Lachnospiraceae bacterium]